MDTEKFHISEGVPLSQKTKLSKWFLWQEQLRLKQTPVFQELTFQD